MENIKQFLLKILNLKNNSRIVITTSAVVIGSLFVWQFAGKYFGYKYTPLKIARMAIPNPQKKFKELFSTKSNPK